MCASYKYLCTKQTLNMEKCHESGENKIIQGENKIIQGENKIIQGENNIIQGENVCFLFHTELH
jgi:hypothetical protein